MISIVSTPVGPVVIALEEQVLVGMLQHDLGKIDVIDAVGHRETRYALSWNEPADLANVAELPMRWYLRGNFSSADAVETCGQVEHIASNAVITPPLTEANVKFAANRLGAETIIRVL